MEWIKCKVCMKDFQPNREDQTAAGRMRFPSYMWDYCPACRSNEQNQREQEYRRLEEDRLAKEQKEIERRKIEHMVTALSGGDPKQTEPYLTYMFATFNPKLNQKWFDEARAYNPDKENMLVCGPTGAGKTHLATAIAREALERGYEAWVYPFHSLSDLYVDKIGDKDSIVRRILRNRVVVFDDIGLGTVTDAKVEFIQKILDAWGNQHKKGLVITSNHDLDVLATRYGDRIASRINGLCDRIVEIQKATPDVRALKKMQQERQKAKSTPETAS